jgi:hypothetical protein
VRIDLIGLVGARLHQDMHSQSRLIIDKTDRIPPDLVSQVTPDPPPALPYFLEANRFGHLQPLDRRPALHNRSLVGARQAVALASHLADRPLRDVHLDG